MSTNKDSLFEFPCPFPIKVFGLDHSNFTTAVKQIINQHCDEQDILSWRSNKSKNAKFLAITVTITAQSKVQLDNIYQNLTDNPHIKMAL